MRAPDDSSGDGHTWRERLLAYNRGPTDNRLGFMPAYQLYLHNAYRALAKRFGLEQLFILSAGWGLIPATFLTPAYDITSGTSDHPAYHRRQDDVYENFCLMPDEQEEIVSSVAGTIFRCSAA